MKKVFVITVAFCLLLSLTACSSTVPQVNRDDVEAVILMMSSGSQQYFLSAEEMDRCVELYNQSEKAGKHTGEGGTPNYSVYISLKNGTSIHLNEELHYAYDFAMSKNFNTQKYLNMFLSNFTETYYVNNSELLVFVETLIEEKFSIELPEKRID